jgi:hypothetical protein
VGQAVVGRRGDRVAVSSEPSWNDLLLFDVATHSAAEQLARRLRGTWSTWTESHDYGWTVGIELRPVADDLAFVLREAAEWVRDCGFRGVTFVLDGRAYVLWAAADATARTAAA